MNSLIFTLQERQVPIMSDAARRKERELAQKEVSTNEKVAFYLFSNYCGVYTINLSHYKVLSTLRATIFFASMLHGLLFRELLASHAGVIRGARVSWGRDEIRAPLKRPV